MSNSNTLIILGVSANKDFHNEDPQKWKQPQKFRQTQWRHEDKNESQPKKEEDLENKNNHVDRAYSTIVVLVEVVSNNSESTFLRKDN